jgi:hypothetical protein
MVMVIATQDAMKVAMVSHSMIRILVGSLLVGSLGMMFSLAGK